METSDSGTQREGLTMTNISDHQIFVYAGTIAARYAQLACKYAVSMGDALKPMVAAKLFDNEQAREILLKSFQQGEEREPLNAMWDALSQVPELLDVLTEMVAFDEILAMVQGVPHVDPIPVPITDPSFILDLGVACDLWRKEGRRKLLDEALPHEFEEKVRERVDSHMTRAKLLQGITPEPEWGPGICMQTVAEICRALVQRAGKFWMSAAEFEFEPDDELQRAALSGQRLVYRLRVDPITGWKPLIQADDLRRLVTGSHGKIRLERGGRPTIYTGRGASFFDVILPGEEGQWPFDIPGT
jgi:hypothetical protein